MDGEIFQDRTVPSRNEHITRADQNEQFARSLDLTDGFKVDWAITLLFYSALHYVEAYLSIKGHSRDHATRDTEIQTNGSLQEIWPDYRRLKDTSEEARYRIANYRRTDFEAMDRRFIKIREHVFSKMR